MIACTAAQQLLVVLALVHMHMANRCHDTADLQVQKSWMYLEPIFSAQDIQKQLPSEYRAFDHVHKQLREIMRRTKDRPNALQTASNPSEDLHHHHHHHVTH
jgi:hypothetical protein